VVGLTAILIVTLGVWRVVLRPIRKLDSVVQRVGAGDFDARSELHGKDELAMLGMQLNRTIPRVKELLETRASLDAAHEVQNALLPQEKFNGEGIIIAGRSHSSDQIGGDFFDVVSGAKLKQGRTGIILGDVTGHGVPAALLAATARAYLRGALLEGVDLHSAVTATNMRIHEDAGDTRFIVLLGAFFDASSHELEVVAAGHPGFLLRKNASEFETIVAQGIPLGIDSKAEFTQLRFDSIGDGDLFLIASDGIWEARNSEDEEFGIERLLNTVCEHRDLDPEQILGHIFDGISEWHDSSGLKDDCTVVIAKMLG
jgi:sigma-B regulation protein RsbU (phosphoserine phosphatase)